MKKNIFLVVAYILLFIGVNAIVEINHYTNKTFYEIESFVVDSKGAVYVGKHGVIDKYAKDSTTRIMLPTKGHYTLSISSADELFLQVADALYVFDNNQDRFVPELKGINGENVLTFSEKQNVFVSASGKKYIYHGGLFQYTRITDESGAVVFRETFWNHCATVLKRLQVFGLILAIFMIFSGGRPVLFIKISLNRFSEGKLMDMSQFDIYVSEYLEKVKKTN